MGQALPSRRNAALGPPNWLRWSVRGGVETTPEQPTELLPIRHGDFERPPGVLVARADLIQIRPILLVWLEVDTTYFADS